MKLCLINVPYLSVYGKIYMGHNSTFPLGLGYIASLVQARGHEVLLLDPEAERLDETAALDRVARFAPDLVGLSCVTSNLDNAYDWARRLKARGPWPVMLGGVHATALPEKTLADCPELDFLVMGEGEFVTAEICAALQAGRLDLSRIASVCWRDRGRIVINRRAPFIADLDALPHPTREFTDVRWYRLQPHFERGRLHATVLSSRGCPAACTFCGNITTGRSFRPHSVKYFVDELEGLVRKYRIRHFHIVDDNFAADKARVLAICDEILARGLRITWFIFGRVDHLNDRELLRRMKRAGCVYILFGIESGNPEVLRTIKKQITLEQIEETCRLCREVGIQYVNSFIIGHPGETEATVEDTVRLAIRLKSVMGAFNILIPFPGTAIFNKYYKTRMDGIRSWKNWCSVGDGLPFEYTHTELSTEKLLKLVASAYRRYYLRPGQLWRLLTFIHSPRVFFAYLQGAWGLFKASRNWAGK